MLEKALKELELRIEVHVDNGEYEKAIQAIITYIKLKEAIKGEK